MFSGSSTAIRLWAGDSPGMLGWHCPFGGGLSGVNEFQRAETKEIVKWFGEVLLPWSLIVAGSYGVCCALRDIWRGIRSASWPFAQATITDQRVEHDGDSEGPPTYRLRVSFRYEVDGVEFESHDFQAGECTIAWAEQQKERNEERQFVLVRYNPRNPADAVLKAGVQIGVFIALAITIVMIGLGVMILRN